ncbi:MAG: hypothetical protein H7841_15550 [Magnetospirillum sp. WYHS-4]
MRSPILAAAILSLIAVSAEAQGLTGVTLNWSCQGMTAVFRVGNPGAAWPAPAHVIVSVAGDRVPVIQRDLVLPAGQSVTVDPVLSAGRAVQIRVEPTWPGAQSYSAAATCQ